MVSSLKAVSESTPVVALNLVPCHSSVFIGRGLANQFAGRLDRVMIGSLELTQYLGFFSAFVTYLEN